MLRGIIRQKKTTSDGGPANKLDWPLYHVNILACVSLEKQPLLRKPRPSKGAAL
jgi:hypothetical protein